MAQSFVLAFLVILTIPLLLPCFCTCIDRERQALLQFKAALNYFSDPYATNLSSWEEGLDCCRWDGITCSHTTHHVLGVEIVIHLYGTGNGGFISESLCTLTSLESRHLPFNGLTGTIPDCLGKLSSLLELDLSINSLSGNIPMSVGNMSSLTKLYLDGNSLSGIILLSFGNISSLACLDLSSNSLSGKIPLSFGNMSSLAYLDLSVNSLSGNIPLFFGNVFSLTQLHLSRNQLTGTIPPSLSNLSSLNDLYLSGNQLSGCIPESLGDLCSLNFLDLSVNQLSGCIPESLGDLSSLRYLDLSYNKLNGTLPPTFSKLFFLEVLFVERNTLSLRNSLPELPSSLEYLFLTFNGGQIISEAFFQNLSKLTHMSFSNCVFNSSPPWIPLFQLKSLHMASCKMDGPIPSWVSTQFSLEELELAENNLVGEIPAWLLDMSLVYINLTRNQLQGSLLLNPSAWNELQVLDVSNNAFYGQMPTTSPSGIRTMLLNDKFNDGNYSSTIPGWLCTGNIKSSKEPFQWNHPSEYS